MSSSIAVEIKAMIEISPNFEAFIIALADQPLVTSKVYDRLAERYERHHPLAVASNYDRILGVPALFDRTLLPKLLKLDCQGGAKQLLNKYSDHNFNLNLPKAAIDIDTPTAYQKLIKIMSRAKD